MERVKFTSLGSILCCNFFFAGGGGVGGGKDRLYQSVFEMALTNYENKIFIVTPTSS